MKVAIVATWGEKKKRLKLQGGGKGVRVAIFMDMYILL